MNDRYKVGDKFELLVDFDDVSKGTLCIVSKINSDCVFLEFGEGEFLSVANTEIYHYFKPYQEKVFNSQSHYDNSKGSLYKVGLEREWNPYLFDVVKRLERGGKKDPLKQEIEKSIDVLKIWLNELN